MKTKSNDKKVQLKKNEAKQERGRSKNQKITYIVLRNKNMTHKIDSDYLLIDTLAQT